MKDRIILFLKGVGMGAADVVPGVSGGSIAFITGIYEELLDSIRAVDIEALKLLAKFDIKGLLEKINFWFLATLGAGIVFSALSLSRVILYLLNNFPEMLWSFFFGLIIASALVVSSKVKKWDALSIVLGLVGIGIAYLITKMAPTETPTALWFIFLCGSIAICAMILPGISGSFILLLMGKYEFILTSIKSMDIPVIAVFGIGCATGILSFSRFLNYMLKNYHDATVALPTGFMIGSLNKVWPWKETIETFIDRHGIEKPLYQVNISPLNYEAVTGTSPFLWQGILLAILGFALVYGIEKVTAKN